MPRISSRIPKNDPVAQFIAFASDPKVYGERLEQYYKAQKASEEAEAKAVNAKQELADFQAALDEQKRQQDKREIGLVEREGVIAAREKSALEQTEVADNLVVQSRERQRLADDALADVDRRATEAIAAVKALVKK